MIPKIIHYCWFGRSEKPKSAQKCIASWKKYCPDFEIIEWNEDNFDINMNGYTRMCYNQKKYAFLSDYARLWAVNEHGGFYFDTDVELIKPINMFINYESVYGFETSDYINTGHGFCSIPHGTAVGSLLSEYDKLLDGEHGVRGCPHLNTSALQKLGFVMDGTYQNLSGNIVLPSDYLNPYESSTGRLSITENTVSIHWYSASWMTQKQLMRQKITRPFHRIFGTDCFKWLKK